MYTHNNATNVQWAELEDGKGVGERMGGGHSVFCSQLGVNKGASNVWRRTFTVRSGTRAI